MQEAVVHGGGGGSKCHARKAVIACSGTGFCGPISTRRDRTTTKAGRQRMVCESVCLCVGSIPISIPTSPSLPSCIAISCSLENEVVWCAVMPVLEEMQTHGWMFVAQKQVQECNPSLVILDAEDEALNSLCKLLCHKRCQIYINTDIPEIR